jgi:phage terminase Nu1 subunit (DNA packaging protein)
MISERTSVTTKEILALANFSEQYLSRLERQGIVRRTARNEWPLQSTIRGLFEHIRAESRRGARSAAEAELRRARAREIEVRTAERQHRLVPIEEFQMAVTMAMGAVISNLSSVPARCARHDLQVRRLVEQQINSARERAADELQRQAEALEANGRAVT